MKRYHVRGGSNQARVYLGVHHLDCPISLGPFSGHDVVLRGDRVEVARDRILRA